MPRERLHRFDVILVGGSLANGILAYTLHKLRPDIRWLLISQGPDILDPGFELYHESDIDSIYTWHRLPWLKAFTQRYWPRYQVKFPELSRSIDLGFCALSSAHLSQLLRSEVREEAFLSSAKALLVEPSYVKLENQSLHASIVIDDRPRAEDLGQSLGFDKSLVQLWQVSGASELDLPIAIESRCDQRHGWHYLQVLPWQPGQILIQNHYWHLSPGATTQLARRDILRYMQQRQWQPEKCLWEQEQIRSLCPRLQQSPAGQGVVHNIQRQSHGHLLTGSFMGQSISFALRFARQKKLSYAELLKFQEKSCAYHRRKQLFFQRINQHIIHSFAPSERYSFFERLFRLPESSIDRFYYGEPYWYDKLRLLLVPGQHTHHWAPVVLRPHFVKETINPCQPLFTALKPSP